MRERRLCSSRRLIARRRRGRRLHAGVLPRPRLLLAAAQIVAQRLGAAGFARGVLGAASWGEPRCVGHLRQWNESRGGYVNHSSTRRLTLTVRITATACLAAYSADWSGWTRF